jgi:hypothetical protein
MTDPEGLREKVARIIGSFVVYDDKGGPDTEVLHDVIGGDYDEATRRVYALADAIISGPLQDRVGELEEALRKALPILDDDLCGYVGDTPPSLYDKRGFVCLDDLSCDHDRWKECEATLAALAAIRDAMPEAEWADNTYAETQAAIEHAHPRIARSILSKPSQDAPAGVGGGRG